MHPKLNISGSVDRTFATDSPILDNSSRAYLGQIGPVPVWAKINFSLNAEANVNVDGSGSIEAVVEREKTTAFEARYSAEKPSLNGLKLTKSGPGLTKYGPTVLFDGNAQASVRLIPQMEVHVIDIGGLFANLSPKLSVEGSATLENGELESASTTLKAAVNLNAGFDSFTGIVDKHLPALDPISLVEFPWHYEFPKPEGIEIKQHPEWEVVEPGETANFSVAAVSNKDIEYQWYFDGKPLPDETGVSLTINDFSAADAGEYFVRLQSEGKSKNSGKATLMFPKPRNGFARIPAGSFMMGDHFNEGRDGERPVHEVYVSEFHMGKTEVTYAEWQLIYDWAVSNGYSFEYVSRTPAGSFDRPYGWREGPSYPVRSVPWVDIVKWCNALSERSGRAPVYRESDGSVFRKGEIIPEIRYNKDGYRLPTEAEWEKAARGGLDGKRFPWGNTISHEEANYDADPDRYSYDLSATAGFHPDYDDGGYFNTSPVGSFKPNGYGVHDMAGNVWEWCNDVFSENYYANSPTSNPLGPDSGTYGTEWRSYRGGDFKVNGSDVFTRRVSHRGTDPYSGGYSVGTTGFRLVRNP